MPLYFSTVSFKSGKQLLLSPLKLLLLMTNSAGEFAPKKCSKTTSVFARGLILGIEFTINPLCTRDATTKHLDYIYTPS